ncbi:MAG: MerR family DNA-binding transcriptional regulator [Planctomycetes bacterium]|nr:MerR family DNA-binding transcriptional regulator [Planctomycetota bacterium]
MTDSLKPRKLFKIGEVIEYSGISRQTLHNYTILGLIAAAERTPSGHRLYPEGVFERLRRIKHWKAHRSLVEVKRLLDALDQGADPRTIERAAQFGEPKDAL